MRKKRFFLLEFALVCMVVCAQSGCSLFVPATEYITVRASDQDAQLFVGGREVGAGRATVMVDRNKAVSVMAWKRGYHPVVHTIQRELSMSGWFDLIGGMLFLIPSVGFLAPGAYELEEKDVFLSVAQTG